MLEYRDFPTRIAMNFILFAPSIGYCVYLIIQILEGTLFSTPSNHMLLLGYGALTATILLPITGIIIDRIKRGIFLTILGAIVPPVFGIILLILNVPNEFSPTFEYCFALSAFGGLTFMMVSLTVLLSRTVVVRFRGRIVSSFLALSMFVALLYQSGRIPLDIFGLPLPEIITISTLIGAIALKPWNLTQAPLSTAGTVKQYFISTACLMAAYILWYFNAKSLMISDPEFTTLRLIADLGLVEYAFFLGGIGVAGIVADRAGRKPAFSIAILMMALLTIFSSVFLYIDPGTYRLVLNPIPLLIIERSIEGFLLGLCLLLIWTEIGSARTKGLRVSLIWFFFLGYMTLFWVVDLNVWGLQIPRFVIDIGAQSAILLTLISLYLSGHLPEMVGREMEMEDLELDFDEEQVERTVGTFLEEQDFEAVRHQVEILDTVDVSDSEMSDILGEDISESLPLQQVSGIGSSLETKLRKAGYTSAAQLAGETPSRLASKIQGLSQSRAEKIISSARELVQKSVKSSKSD